MAKGFKVKPKTPVQKEPEWDYELAKQLIRGKKIVFCLPGRGVSYTYLKNFVQLCFDIVQAGGGIQISQDYSSMVNFARCKCLGANVLRNPPNQLPWDGKLEYDWQLWIDSDIVFDTAKFYQLVLNSIPAEAITKQEVTEYVKDAQGNEIKDKDGNSITKVVGHNIVVDDTKVRPIVSGWYCTEDGRTTSVAHWLDEEDFSSNGGVMNHETLDTIQKRKKPFTVDYGDLVGYSLRKESLKTLMRVVKRRCLILGLLQRCRSLSLVQYRICVVKMSLSVSMPKKDPVMKSGATLAFV